MDAWMRGCEDARMRGCAEARRRCAQYNLGSLGSKAVDILATSKRWHRRYKTIHLHVAPLRLIACNDPVCQLPEILLSRLSSAGTKS
jgi:hypothetical protein